MKKIDLIKALDEIVSTQLKAYYLSHIDKNTAVIADAKYLDLDWAVFTFPEWVVPAFSLAAAAIAVFKITKAFAGWLGKK